MSAKKDSKRILIFDKIRGIAVILMILSHTVDFFYTGDNLAMEFIRWFGATLAFSLFLYVSGAVSYLAYLWHVENKEKWQQKQSRLLGRIINVLLIYYAIAFVGNIGLLSPFSLESAANFLFKTLLFVEVPSYSEFLLPFIFYTFLLLALGKQIRRIVSNQIFILGVSILAYVIGSYFYQVDLGYWGNVYKSIFFGHERLFRFPVFQYLPIYLLGIYTGYLKTHSSIKKLVSSLTTYFSVSGVALFLMISQTWTQISGGPAIYITRWPPSVSFILVGIVFTLGLLIVFQLYDYVVKYGVKKGILTYLGENAFLYYVYHILLLYTYRMTIDQRFSSILLIFIVFLALMTACTLIILLGNRFGPKFGIISNIEMKALAKSKYMDVFYRLLVIGGLVLMLLLINTISSQRPADVVNANVEGISYQQPEYKEEWWNEDFLHHRQFSLTNNSGIEVLGSGETIGLQINHKQLVDEAKSSPTGSDIRLVHWHNSRFSEIEFEVVSPGKENSIIYFSPAEDLAPEATDNNYFIYYNNPNLKDSSAPKLAQEVSTTYRDYSIELGDEEGANFETAINRTWFLKDINSDDEVTNIKYTVDVKNFEELRDQDLRMVLTEPSGNERVLIPLKTAAYTYKLELNTNDLETGTYNLRTVIDDTQFTSGKSTFNVSYPLYVTWTMDWEGYDVSERYLSAMDDIANKYGMPMTTYFNPRIFAASDISETRRQRLVNWALAGQESRGDEIALHLHMHIDMIEQTEVEEPLTEPRWGGRENGHDVLTTAYDYDDFSLIIEWSLEKFEEYGLPRPVSYRGGGWFLDETNLQVLQDYGFRLDSSGREAIVYGPNRVENPWNLTSTTRPYKPSLNDQNSDTPPTFDIWEFPNNGMDSTNHDLDVLLSKFKDNYQGKPLEEYQVLTYLSHPHWLSTYDEADIRGLFDYLEDFNYENDQGPVVYTTLVGALDNIED